MPVITSENKIEIKKNTINDGNLKQLDKIFENNSANKNSGEIEIKTETPVKTPKKREYSDSIVINLPKGERANFKVFCAQCNITMTDFIYFAMDYIRDGVQEGKFTLSRGGIKTVKKDFE